MFRQVRTNKFFEKNFQVSGFIFVIYTKIPLILQFYSVQNLISWSFWIYSSESRVYFVANMCNNNAKVGILNPKTSDGRNTKPPTHIVLSNENERDYARFWNTGGTVKISVRKLVFHGDRKTMEALTQQCQWKKKTSGRANKQRAS